MSNDHNVVDELFHTTDEDLSATGLPKLTADDLMHNFDLCEKTEKRNIMNNFLYDGNAFKTTFDICTKPETLVGKPSCNIN